MLLGTHVSIAGSIDKAIDNAVARNCTAFQIFLQSPRSWYTKELSDKDIKNYKQKLEDSKIDRFATFAEMPMLPNLSSSDKKIFEKSFEVLIEHTKRCRQLGIPYLITKLGYIDSEKPSFLDKIRGTDVQKKPEINKAVETTVKVIKKAVEETSSDVIFILENTFNSTFRTKISSNLEQLSSIFSQLKSLNRFGICFDTCHAFIEGYDLRTKTAVDKTLQKFNEMIGFEHLKLIHLNDSKMDIGSKIDRHYHIGLGKIGEEGLRHVIKFAKSRDVPIILETPIDDIGDDFSNLLKVRVLSETCSVSKNN